MMTASGVNYQVFGDGSPAIIFVHGFSCGLDDWQAQIAALAPRFRCVALDLPGHGASSRLAVPAMSGLGEAVNDVRRDIGAKRVVLVGHSLGCKVIREAYWSWGDGVCGLVLIDGAFYDGDGQTMRERAAAKIDRAGFTAFAAEHFEGMFSAASVPEVRARIVARAAAMDPDYGRALYLEAVAWDSARGKETLRRITAPVLVLQSTNVGSDLQRHSMQPGMTSGFIEVVAEQVSTLEAKIVAGVGHFTMIEAPDEVSEVISSFAVHTKAV